MDPTTCQYYLQLLHGGKIPVPVLSRLLREFGSMKTLCAQSESTLKNLGFDDTQISHLRGGNGSVDSQQQIEAALEWSNHSENYLLCYESEYYPALLREIDSAPPLLFVRGSVSVLSERLLSVVGSRKASVYGKRNAYWIARELSKAGLHIGSGLAGGIDTKAHEGALEGGGKTIAVVGTGIDRVYPARNASLADRIVAGGALVSEFPLGTPPYPSNFPRRNRIISGLAEGIDTVAHRTAIEEGGRTIAVLGTPLSKAYPATNAGLLEEIKRDHLAISQFPEGYPGKSENFPRRNRTMALICDATIVIEASEKSGTRHQGWEAIRLGRDLYLLENVATNPNLTWPKQLIEYGAQILRREDLPDILLDIPNYTAGGVRAFEL